MKYRKPTIWMLFIGTMFLLNCNGPETEGQNSKELTQVVNPAADGFNTVGSDAKAIEIADQVMEAMGGRAAWDATRFISWNFFGRRHLTWDKSTGNVRIQTIDSTVYQVNIFNGEGAVLKEGQTLSNQDSIAKYLNIAKRIWINDAYWLVMPFKLKDSGVTLKHVGEDSIQDNTIAADVLELTFQEVGVTPNNKYLVYVDQSDHLIKQWDYYSNATDSLPRISTPWINYEQKGAILLSADRGERKLLDVEVHESLPDTVFSSLSLQ